LYTYYDEYYFLRTRVQAWRIGLVKPVKYWRAFKYKPLQSYSVSTEVEYRITRLLLWWCC